MIFTVSATSDCKFDTSVRPHVSYPETATAIRSVRASAIFATRDDARAFVATLPKAWRVAACYLGGSSRGSGLAEFSANFSADKSNKGTNEAGLKRLRAFLGRVAYTYKSESLNAATLEQFERFLATGSLRNEASE